MNDTTYDVRVYKTEVYKGKNVTTYWVRWKTEHLRWKEPFRKAAQADSFRSSLLTAARNGEAFSLDTGRPISWTREKSSLTWYTFTLSYVDTKWPHVSPNHRRGIAEALTDIAEALLTGESPYSRDMQRAALRWAYSDRIRDGGEPPAECEKVIRWLEEHTVPMAEFAEKGKGAILARKALDRIRQTKDGKPAAANTANRKRMVFNNAMEYACEINVLPSNPLKGVKWTRPRTLSTVNPRAVINAEQARRFLAAVDAHSERGKRMVAFFGCMNYAAMRPEEVVDLRREHLVSLPDDGWGEARLTNAEPRSGSRWTNNGKPRERRELKHRAQGDIRVVPIHPDLVRLLRAHLDLYGTNAEGRVFVGPRGGLMTDRAYLKVFHEARAKAFTKEEAASPLMDVPYSLRHAAVSTWLNAGVEPPKVAEWAGHSVDVLLRVYAKCIHGQDKEAMRRILAATA